MYNKLLPLFVILFFVFSVQSVSAYNLQDLINSFVPNQNQAMLGDVFGFLRSLFFPTVQQAATTSACGANSCCCGCVGSTPSCMPISSCPSAGCGCTSDSYCSVTPTTIPCDNNACNTKCINQGATYGQCIGSACTCTWSGTTTTIRQTTTTTIRQTTTTTPGAKCCCFGAGGGGASCTSSCYYDCSSSPCNTQTDCYATTTTIPPGVTTTTTPPGVTTTTVPSCLTACLNLGCTSSGCYASCGSMTPATSGDASCSSNYPKCCCYSCGGTTTTTVPNCANANCASANSVPCKCGTQTCQSGYLYCCASSSKCYTSSSSCGSCSSSSTTSSSTTSTTSPNSCDAQKDYVCRTNPCYSYQQPCGSTNLYKCSDTTKYCCTGTCQEPTQPCESQSGYKCVDSPCNSFSQCTSYTDYKCSDTTKYCCYGTCSATTSTSTTIPNPSGKCCCELFTSNFQTCQLRSDCEGKGKCLNSCDSYTECSNTPPCQCSWLSCNQYCGSKSGSWPCWSDSGCAGGATTSTTTTTSTTGSVSATVTGSNQEFSNPGTYTFSVQVKTNVDRSVSCSVAYNCGGITGKGTGTITRSGTIGVSVTIFELAKRGSCSPTVTCS